MRLLNIESSPRGSRSASIAMSSAFLEAYRQTCPGVTADTLNVWEEKLPDFDHEAIGANYKGINKEPMDQAEAAVWDKIQELGVLAGKSREEQRFPSPDLRLAAEHASLELYRNNETPTPLEPRPEWP